MLDQRVLREYLEFATEAANQAGAITLRFFRKELQVQTKSDDTPVTIADRMAETHIREKIQRRYHSHSVLGEEFTEKDTGSPFRWVIDPIDGTQSFIRGVPLYTVLVALEYDRKPVVGVIHCPALRETVAAATGLGCFHNSQPCHVSTTESLFQAWVHLTDYADLETLRPGVGGRLASKALHCRAWGDAYGYLLVATGRADVMIDPVMKEWDIAPLMPIIVEAGGRFTDLEGIPNATGSSSLATNGILHDQVMDMIRGISKH